LHVGRAVGDFYGVTLAVVGELAGGSGAPVLHGDFDGATFTAALVEGGVVIPDRLRVHHVTGQYCKRETGYEEVFAPNIGQYLLFESSLGRLKLLVDLARCPLVRDGLLGRILCSAGISKLLAPYL
jgi:hypothetical protein